MPHRKTAPHRKRYKEPALWLSFPPEDPKGSTTLTGNQPPELKRMNVLQPPRLTEMVNCVLCIFCLINFLRGQKLKIPGIEDIKAQDGSDRPHVQGPVGGQACTPMGAGTSRGLSRSRVRPDAGAPAWM